MNGYVYDLAAKPGKWVDEPWTLTNIILSNDSK